VFALQVISARPTRDISGPKIPPLPFGATNDAPLLAVNANANAPVALAEGMNATGTMKGTATVTGTATAGGAAPGPHPDVPGPPPLTGGAMTETAIASPIEMIATALIVNATVTVPGPLLFPLRKSSRKIMALQMMIGTTTETGTIREKMAVLPPLTTTEYQIYQLAWPALINFFLNFSISVFRKNYYVSMSSFIDSLCICLSPV